MAPKYCDDCRKKVIKARATIANKKNREKQKAEKLKRKKNPRKADTRGKVYEDNLQSSILARKFLKENKRKRMALSTNSSCFDAGEFYG